MNAEILKALEENPNITVRDYINQRDSDLDEHEVRMLMLGEYPQLTIEELEDELY